MHWVQFGQLGRVDTDDQRAFGVSDILNRCLLGDSASMMSGSLSPLRLLSNPRVSMPQVGAASSALWILGKPAYDSGKEIPQSILYQLELDPDGDVNDIASTVSSPMVFPGDGRLVSDSQGHVYQVGEHGLIRQDTGQVIVEPQVIQQPDRDSTILIGFHDVHPGWENEGNEGFLLQDCAFDPHDPSIVYVVPVWVDSGNCPYMAAAKLQLTGDGTYDVLELYGTDPATDPSQTHSLIDCSGDLLQEPDRQHLVEIEIDTTGEYLYVLNRHMSNANNRILIYAEADGSSPVFISELHVEAPTAMVVSAYADKLYLTSSIVSPGAGDPNDPNNTNVCVYSFSVNTGGPNGLLTFEESIPIEFPLPDFDIGQGSKAIITSITENPIDGILYVTGFTMPRFPDECNMSDEMNRLFPDSNPQIFTTPVLALVDPGSDKAEVRIIKAGNPSLALPLSIVWTE